MPRMQETSFILSVLCVILLHPQCTARNTMDSSPPNSAPTSAPSQAPSPSDPLPPSASSFTGSISEILKRMISPKYKLNLSPFPQPNPNPNPALKSICDSTDYPEICVSSVSPVLSSGGSVDPVSVLEASIRACIEPLNDAVGNLSSASNTTKPGASDSSDSASASALADCEDNYADALDSLENALKAIQSRDMGTINSMLSAVVSDISTCDDAFQDTKDSAIAEFNGLIMRMASNCLAVASMIHYTNHS